MILSLEERQQALARGGRPVRIGRAALLYPDGFQIDHGQWVMPPADPIERLQARKRYHGLRLAMIEADLKALDGDPGFTWTEALKEEYNLGWLGRPTVRARLTELATEEKRLIASLDEQLAAAV